MSGTVTTLKFPRLSETSGAELSRMIDDVEPTTGLIAVVDEQLPDDCLQSAISAMDNDPRLAGSLVIQCPADSGRRVELPSWLAPFIPVDPVRAAVFVGNCLEESQLGGFRDVDEPLRELFVRIVAAGLSIQSNTVDRDSGKPGTIRRQLPLLRPEEPGRRRHWLVDAVVQLPLTELLGHNPSKAEAAAIRAGILQVNDFLDASHSQSQSVEGAPNADYWHAIMHRREPDYSNSKYWFRRVGTHEIFGELATAAAELLEAQPEIAASWKQRLLPSGEWDPFAFVDLCESCPRNEDDELSLFARKLQWVEMQLLLRHVVFK